MSECVPVIPVKTGIQTPMRLRMQKSVDFPVSLCRGNVGRKENHCNPIVQQIHNSDKCHRPAGVWIPAFAGMTD